MTDEPLVSVDFMKTDPSGRILLTTVGTRRDLVRNGIVLEEGLLLHLCTDDVDEEGNPGVMLVDGVAHFDSQNDRWVASIDRSTIRRVFGD